MKVGQSFQSTASIIILAVMWFISHLWKDPFSAKNLYVYLLFSCGTEQKQAGVNGPIKVRFRV